jgi:hypothetical protein
VNPPYHIYPSEELNVIEKKFFPSFLEMIKTIVKGYLSVQRCVGEGVPTVQKGTFVNGFDESWPIVYGDDGFGFARKGGEFTSRHKDVETHLSPQAPSFRSHDRHLAIMLSREELCEFWC